MPAKNPRLTMVVEKPLYRWLKKSAREKGVSLSLLLRDMVKDAYEQEEDIFWAREGEARRKTFDPKTALTHEEVFGKKK